jgi:hypothetical protein
MLAGCAGTADTVVYGPAPVLYEKVVQAYVDKHGRAIGFLYLDSITGPKQVREGGKYGYLVCAEQRETKGESIPPGVIFIRAGPTRTTKAMTGYFLIRNNEMIDAGMDAAGGWITDLCKKHSL